MNPQNIRAVIVGINKYKEQEWYLAGPAHDALRMIQWLIACCVPLKNITLFASSADKINYPDGIDFRDPSREAFANFFMRGLKGIQCDALLVFWGGHGCLKGIRERHLLCSDATRDDIRTLPLFDILYYCKSISRNQIWIIDACAGHVEITGFQEKITPLSVPSAKSWHDSLQKVVFSTQHGEYAQDSSQSNTGAFSQAFFNQIRGKSFDDLFVNLNNIVNGITETIGSKGIQAKPTIFYTDGTGGGYHFEPQEYMAPILMFSIEPSNISPTLRNVSGWVWRSMPHKIDSKERITLAEAEKWIGNTVSEYCAKDVWADNLLIEIFCNEKDFVRNFHRVKIAQQAIGFNHKVVVRSLARAQRQGSLNWTQWNQSWSQSKSFGSIQLCSLTSQNNPYAVALMVQDHFPGYCVVIELAGKDRNFLSMLNSVLAAGASQAIWLSERHEADSIEKALGNIQHATIPERVRACRREALGNNTSNTTNCIGDRLVLLWDDPTRNPFVGPLLTEPH